MGLQADQAVDDVHARLLERPGPPDVRLLVEAGLELDQGGHLLAALGRADQRLDDRACRTRGAVERLLDGEHLGVARGLADELLDRGGERVVRVVDQDVACAEHREEVRDLVVDRGRRGWVVGVHGCSLRSGRSSAVQRHRLAEVEQAVVLVDVVGLEVELARQQLADLAASWPGRPRGGRPPVAPAAAQLDLDGGQQVLGLLVDVVEVGVAGDPERVVALDLHAGEEQPRWAAITCSSGTKRSPSRAARSGAAAAAP